MEIVERFFLVALPILLVVCISLAKNEFPQRGWRVVGIFASLALACLFGILAIRELEIVCMVLAFTLIVSEWVVHYEENVVKRDFIKVEPQSKIRLLPHGNGDEGEKDNVAD